MWFQVMGSGLGFQQQTAVFYGALIFTEDGNMQIPLNHNAQIFPGR